MTDLNNPMAIVRMVATAGPPFRYNTKSDTYDCGYCGLKKFTIDEVFDECEHDRECPWRLAKELTDKLS